MSEKIGGRGGGDHRRTGHRDHPRTGCRYGLLVGICSGADVYAARQMAAKMPGNIATVLPDRAERYFSTALM